MRRLRESGPPEAGARRAEQVSASSPWIARVRRTPGASWRLFCFPYAGGSAGLFTSWAHLLAPVIDVCALRLPGRAERLREPPFTRMEPLADAIACAIAACSDTSFAFFGHSMGAMVSFEVARLLRQRGERQPCHLLLSACPAPRVPARHRPCHQLPEEAFLEELRRLNGTPAEALANRELVECLLPTVRADFEVMETHCYRPGPPLDVPILAVGGTRDPDVSPDDLAAWRMETTMECSLRLFDGDHFFLHGAERALAAVVRAQLTGSSR